MQYERPDPKYERVATIDIETTAINPADGELVAIGIGVHDRGDAASEVTYDLAYRTGDDEATLVNRAIERLSTADPDLVVSYNGAEFDVPFMRGRCTAHDSSFPETILTDPDSHLDLMAARKRLARRTDRRYPSLEACLGSYGYEPAKTVWKGEVVTNRRFGEELGPAYLGTLAEGDTEQIGHLQNVIDHYLVTDLEATLSVYYHDVGVSFEPQYSGTVTEF